MRNEETSFYTKKELQSLGLKRYGKNVLISSKSSFYGAGNIVIGDNTRIDDFTVVSAVDGFIVIGSHTHISSHCLLIGKGGIVLSDFCTISSFSGIYSASDDFSGRYLIGPMNDADLIHVHKAKVTLEKYTACGAHSIILPGVTLRQGAVLGACSLANKDMDEWQIYIGIPAKSLKPRERDLIEKAKILEARWKQRLEDDADSS
jgi:galactoside O-acetyltransferase